MDMAKLSVASSQRRQSGAPEPNGEVSLVRGGPFYRIQEAIRLVTPQHWNLGPRILLAIGFGWVPLVLLTFLFKSNSIWDLLRDYSVNVRMLIAVPVLLLGQVVMENVFRMIVHHLHEAELLPSPEQAKLDRTIGRLLRLRDSFVAEALIVVIAYGNVAAIIGAHKSAAQGWALGDFGWGHHLSPAGWYYALVSQLIFRFLVGISLWKWFLWICFLFRLSRLDMELVPTHPDQHGGIGFLGMSPMAIAPTVFVVCGAIGSTWRAQILDHVAHVMNFKMDAIVLLVIMLLVAMGPLVLFVPKLGRLHRQGILQYGTLGQLHSIDFHKKWILNRTGHEEEFLTAPEISTLTDYASSYENVEKLQPFPLDRGATVALVFAVVLPLLPVVLSEIPLVTVVKGLLAAVK
jgi:hypothetical protein